MSLPHHHLLDPAHWTPDVLPIPAVVLPVIKRFYIEPAIKLAHDHGLVLVPSCRSIYRPPSYEIRKGRSGRSLHTFADDTFGAADLTTADGSPVIHHLDTLVDHSPFLRLCIYPAHNFVHVDYGHSAKPNPRDRSLWSCDRPSGQWIKRSQLQRAPHVP